MSTDTDIKCNKYKLQQKITELNTRYSTALQREKTIYETECARIDIKFTEYKQHCNTQKSELSQKSQQHAAEVLNIIAEKDIYLAELATLETSKVELRKECLRQIKDRNRIKKTTTQQIQTYQTELDTYTTEKQNYEKQIANYTKNRHAINEDYYNWENDKQDLSAKITTLCMDTTASQQRLDILTEYLRQLDDDIRGNPVARYLALDNQQTELTNKIAVLDYKINKTHKYITLAATQSQTELAEISLPTYLDSAKHRIPHCKLEINRCNSEIVDIDNKRLDIEKQIDAIDDTQLPPDLAIQQQRANTRLDVSTRRIHNEYTPLLKSLMQQKMQIGDSITPVDNTTTADNTVLCNTIDGTVDTDYDGSSIIGVVDNENIAGREISSKEMRRRKIMSSNVQS